MNRNMKILLICLLVSWIITGTFIANEFVPIMKSPRLIANVYLIAERAGMEDSVSTHAMFILSTHNIITDHGEHIMRDVWGFNNITTWNATKWISLGNNSAVSQTDTKLDAELTASNGTRLLAPTITGLVIGGDYAVNFTAKFCFTGFCRFNATGIHHNPTSNSDFNMVADAILTTYSWGNKDNATVIWSFIFNAN